MLFPKFVSLATPTSVLQFLPMALVFCINDYCDILHFQYEIRNERTLRPDVRGVPRQGRKRFPSTTGLKKPTCPQSYSSDNCFHPRLKEFFHGHCPRNTVEIA